MATSEISEDIDKHHDNSVPQPRPFIAIVGRPNVGKSTLYNRLTRSRDAIVDDRPGITRDRMVGIGRIGNTPYWIVDTGGIESDDNDLHGLMKSQVDAALEECEAVIFIADGRDGPTPVDDQIARQLRGNKHLPIYLAVNKVEGLEKNVVTAEFYQLGLGEPHAISSKNGDGVSVLIDSILAELKKLELKPNAKELDNSNPLISIIGRPNVGKSTLVNSIAGEERVVVYDMPGTTRDLSLIHI